MPVPDSEIVVAPPAEGAPGVAGMAGGGEAAAGVGEPAAGAAAGFGIANWAAIVVCLLTMHS